MAATKADVVSKDRYAADPIKARRTLHLKAEYIDVDLLSFRNFSLAFTRRIIHSSKFDPVGRAIEP
jgi:hypothetical protein